MVFTTVMSGERPLERGGWDFGEAQPSRWSPYRTRVWRHDADAARVLGVGRRAVEPTIEARTITHLPTLCSRGLFHAPGQITSGRSDGETEGFTPGTRRRPRPARFPLARNRQDSKDCCGSHNITSGEAGSNLVVGRYSVPYSPRLHQG